jgi:hypothetical protein
MKSIGKGIFILVCILSFVILTAFSSSKAMAFTTQKAAFDVNKMGDVSDFDPNKPVIPTRDTIKIAVVASFSGPAAQVGEIYWMCALFKND